MKTEAEIRLALREWVLQKSGGKIDASTLNDSTPIIENRIISSVQVMDLILYLESLRGKPVDVQSLKPGVFHHIDAIYQNFFQQNFFGDIG